MDELNVNLKKDQYKKKKKRKAEHFIAEPELHLQRCGNHGSLPIHNDLENIAKLIRKKKKKKKEMENDVVIESSNVKQTFDMVDVKDDKLSKITDNNNDLYIIKKSKKRREKKSCSADQKNNCDDNTLTSNEVSKTKTTVNELENINSCISCGKLLKKTSSNCVCEVANVERTDKYGKIIIDIDCDVGSSMTTRTQKKVKRKSIDSSLDTPVYVAKEIETEIKETKHGKKKKDVIIIDEVDSENDIGVNKLKDNLPVLVDSDQVGSTKVVSAFYFFF